MPRPAQHPLTPIRCELCGGPMRLIRRIPVVGAQPQKVLYQCEQCAHTMTLPIKEEAH